MMESMKRKLDSPPTGDAERPLRLRLAGQANTTHEDMPASLARASCPAKRDIIDPNGDLTLVVGQATSKEGAAKPASDDEGPRAFTVSAKVLSQGSKVFEGLIFGESSVDKKHNAGEERVLQLPDDNPRAMANLLNIMHLHFENILPADQATIKEVYDITVLTDKYDVGHLLGPWMSAWLKALPSLVDMDFRGRCQRLWIAWVVGDLVSFEQILASLARHCRISESTTESGGDPSYGIRYGAREPPGVLNVVMAHRLKMIRATIEPLEASINCLINGLRPDPHGLGCRRVEDGQDNQCNTMILGSLIRSLNKAELWPLPTVSELYRSKMTVVEIRLRVLRLDITTDPDHPNCSQQTSKKGHRGIRWVPPLDRISATDAQRQHMAARALKTRVLSN